MLLDFSHRTRTEARSLNILGTSCAGAKHILMHKVLAKLVPSSYPECLKNAPLVFPSRQAAVPHIHIEPTELFNFSEFYISISPHFHPDSLAPRSYGAKLILIAGYLFIPYTHACMQTC